MIKLSLKLDVSSSNLVLGIVGLSAVASAVYCFSSVGKVNNLSKFMNKTSIQKKSKSIASNVHELNAKEGNDKKVSMGSECNTAPNQRIDHKETSRVNNGHKASTKRQQNEAVKTVEHMMSSINSNSSHSNNPNEDSCYCQVDHVCIKDENNGNKILDLENDNISCNVGDEIVRNVEVENKDGNIIDNNENLCLARNNVPDTKSSDKKFSVREDDHKHQSDLVSIEGLNQNNENQLKMNDNDSCSIKNGTVTNASNENCDLLKVQNDENICLTKNKFGNESLVQKIRSSENSSSEALQDCISIEHQSKKATTSSNSCDEAKQDKTAPTVPKQPNDKDLIKQLDEIQFKLKVLVKHITVFSEQLTYATNCLENITKEKNKKLRQALNEVKLHLEAENNLYDNIPKVLNDDIFNEFVQQLITLRKIMWTELECFKSRLNKDVKLKIVSNFDLILSSFDTAKESLKHVIKLIGILRHCINTGVIDSDDKHQKMFFEIELNFGFFYSKLDLSRRNCLNDTLNEKIKRISVLGNLVFTKEIRDNLLPCLSDIIKN